ncbi:MAG TPA: hypothetical protein VFQ50_07855 [Flavobacterium sp.]|nr:hypothetical protein [Flavobacterium sp.]
MNNFKLQDAPKISTGFTIPDDYFDTFPAKVLQLTRKQQTPVISMYNNRRKYIYAAAAIVVMAFSITFLNKQPQTSEIDDATIENYLAYNAGISQYELLTVLESEDIQHLEKEYAFDDAVLEDELMTGQNFEQYVTE